MTDVLAIIPARGGSKGIPRKNIRMVAGQPLLAYSIKHALTTPAITRVCVSTDDRDIAIIARAQGAEVIWRPAEISGDTATSEAALLHALHHFKSTENYEPELVAFLQATSPLRQPNDIQNAIETMQSEGADSLFSACPVQSFIWHKTGTELTSLTYDYQRRPRRQDLQGENLSENGSFYLFKPWVLRQFDNRLGGRVATYRMSALDSFQVDVPADLELIETLLAAPRRAYMAPPSLGEIQLLAIDFGGVMTDNRVLVSENGQEAVLCHRGDGWGLARLREAGVKAVVISTETNPVVAARCEKLNLEFAQGCADKLGSLKQIAAVHNLSAQQIAYVGNDVNDLQCLGWVGKAIVVADATPQARAAAELVTSRSGGHGAIQEVCDWILAARNESRE